ncbi:EAL domain-containing protein [Nocardioides sp. YIM 152588]|uniref:putative bifunctional diguanylate cyclase/phosphodiesterase n=1 Tax=Nocardioides sp. YIM 152588 TaxID=3158259 RepID=UPI0032E3A905
MSEHSDDTMVKGGAADLERTLRAVVDSAPHAILLTDVSGCVVLANPQAERLYGYDLDTLVGMPAAALMPARHRAQHAAMRARFLAEPHVREPREQRDGRRFLALRSDGTEVPVEAGMTPVWLDDELFIMTSITDVTERVAARSRAEGDLRRSILDSLPFSVLATDRCGSIVAANPAAAALVGRPPDQLVGRTLASLAATPYSPLGGPAAGLATLVGQELEIEYQRPDGSSLPVLQVVSEMRDVEGLLGGYLVVAYDITARRQAQDAVRRMTTHDALTNLPNRTQLERHLGAAIAEAAESGAEGALLLLDLDHFQRVNDSLGHQVGDQVLLEIAERLRRWSDDDTFVARFGGDEFVVVVRDATRLPTLTADLAADLARTVEVDGRELSTTLSMGGALFPGQGADPTVVIQHADTAMYYAKAAGRNQLQWFNEGMRERTNERLSLASALRLALREGELSVAYQPQVDLATGRTVGFEALARWQSPTLGTVGPHRFIPVAEETGLIVELGAWVLERACADIVRIQAEIGRPMRLAVNASPHQFHAEGWVETVVEILDRTGLDPGQLELEITEGVLMDDQRHVLETLRRLREIGISIAVDDFGLGYSSLAYLARFPMDKLKIDRAFVNGLQPQQGRAPIIDAIVGMAHALGMDVVAEGVETPDQERYLRSRGCDEAQGFLYSAAVAPKDAFRAARRRRASV